MKRLKINNIIICFILMAISYNAIAQMDMPSDINATKETINLYHNLKKLMNKGFMFGHQDDLAYGVGWKYEKDRSDVKDVTGDYPALYGWDLGNIESVDNTNNIDGVPFKKMKQFIKEGYERGGVITISWHQHSPLDMPKGAWDTTHGTVASILPGGINNELYKTWLDKVAAFLSSLKGSNGETIPVLFRPFHELTGSWFWWGKNECSEFEFKTLWRFVVYYLKEVKKIHNLLYVFNEADFASRDDFLKRYPGDDVVDVVSFDGYQYNDPAKDDGFIKWTGYKLSVLDSIAAEKNKIPALAETGYEAIPYANWWTDVLVRTMGDHKISYVLVWRNHGYNESMKKMHYYAPYKGQVSEEDFKKFYSMDKTLFEKEVSAEKLYR